ncbi:MAG: DNA starvation/stationary phase protection protein [Anaerolineaceae bacterium]|nr:DNA starvation/stationary phase protection protein [Anaerolineaceae bacterium]
MATKSKRKKLEQAHIGLAAENREKLIPRLNQLLADEHLLYTKTRNYHWNVTGIHFSQLHELFEEQYNSLQLIADEVAERSRMLGGTAVGTLVEFLEHTRLSEAPGAIPSAPDMLANLLDDHEQVITSLRDDIEACMEEFNDEGTADLLIGTMRAHEKMAWMLRSMANGG